jgi:hypothetical protein
VSAPATALLDRHSGARRVRDGRFPPAILQVRADDFADMVSGSIGGERFDACVVAGDGTWCWGRSGPRLALVCWGWREWLGAN